MSLLQVRDFPENTYNLLALAAKKEKRSITQETIFILENQLLQKEAETTTARNNALDSLSAMNLTLPKNAPSATKLVRNDRDASFKKGGRLR